MSRYGSDKEFYMCLSFKFNSQQLEQALNVKMTDDIELDMNFHGRKVDFVSVLEDGRLFYMELQLGKADETHLKQVMHVIENAVSDDYVLVWIALEHNEVFLHKIYKMIDSLNKSICFFALCINSELLPYLDVINKMQMKDIVKSFTILDNVQKHFLFSAMYYRAVYKRKPVYELSNHGIKEYDLDNKQDVMRIILRMIRKNISYYPSVHRSKKFDGNVISLGSGIGGAIYSIGIKRSNVLFIELKFCEANQKLFADILLDKEGILDKFDYMVEFNVEERKVGSYFYFGRNKELKLKQLVRMVKKFVDYFSAYFYSRQVEVFKEL